jgi:ferredoxin-NADP reductase
VGNRQGFWPAFRARAPAGAGKFRNAPLILLGVGGVFLGGFPIFALETLDASGRIHQLLFPGEEGMTVGADFDAQHLVPVGGARLERVPARAVHHHFVVIGMNPFFHDNSLCSLESGRWAGGPAQAKNYDTRQPPRLPSRPAPVSLPAAFSTTIFSNPMPNPNFPVARKYRAMLRRVRALTENTKHLEWEVTEGGRFDFLAGQFVSMTLDRDGDEHTRAYSIASAPRADAGFDICLNRVAGGLFSNYLCDLEPGAAIDFTGPHGFFVVRRPIERDLVFVATGTGIAAIRGMLEDLFVPGATVDRDIWLVFGVRLPETILYRDEFERLAAQHPRFHFLPTLSRAPENWPGERGRVQEHLRSHFAGRRDLDVYICGLKAMVDDVRRILKEEFGLDRRQIHYEKYD